ncbi:hypothetical protein SAMN05216464_11133 [Mucilaginibacter pineti]|uniref:Uncharacterized protein n=1 Tax=Mucilaginibacter pineti TaxID=1391627 RepID=A0A1G7H327_9SPHI|nr:hypothetical protein [Mucilaginibacter pineti]SDE94714.1 hypothetical protein SAMN05216464_11133 [Mucilaginibacter pineti]
MATKHKIGIFGAGALLLALVLTTVVLFAFKADSKHNKKVEQKFERNTKKFFASQWYLIDASDNNPANQDITSTTGSAPSSPGCNTTNTGVPCAVNLSFSGAVPSIPAGTTVQEAVDDYGATVGSYTREP